MTKSLPMQLDSKLIVFKTAVQRLKRVKLAATYFLVAGAVAASRILVAASRQLAAT